MVTYFGTSEHGLDEKGRLILPNRILDQVAKAEWKFYLTAGLDRCLLLHDSQGWSELMSKLGRGVPGSRAHRALCRRFLGLAEEVVPDATRRIRIPEPLQKYAGLDQNRSAVLVGSGRVMEIWAQDHLGSTLGEASPEEESLFASLIGSEQKPSSTPAGA